MKVTREYDGLILAIAAALAALVWWSAASGAEPTKDAPRERVCAMATNGAVEGESIGQRLARLETALRLTKAEIKVNAPRRKR